MQPPVFDIDPASLHADPYPAYARMLAEAPICFVPQLDAVLITRRDDIFTCEKDIATFSSDQPGGLMNMLMGHNMMRKDGDAHMQERRLFFPAVSPRAVSNVWREKFHAIGDEVLEELAPLGQMDLVRDYAMRISGEALKQVTGLTQVRWQDLDAWSQAMIDGIANYAGVPEVEARCHEATAAIDAAISERLDELTRRPDASLISVMLHGGMKLENIRHNIKLAISGGQNEPRDAVAGAAFALLAHPEQLAMAISGKADWLQAFEEYCRWIAPIGMSPRRIARDASHDGVQFSEGSRAFLMFAAGNRDPAIFDRPERFDLTRDVSKSVSFGAGPHFCAGAWVSRTLVAEVALPKLFARLEGLELAERDSVEFAGWAFRGPRQVRVRWRT